ncbi:MAG: 16S rRNA (adenine(1518)-N(6)/adenine(1519)-N(6))-dimethyltransferase RsmA [Oscillospiraceae bacterium]|jgi:16S rRNA (adenine1518-N6/adenine1519-N6)-dimethyltransferase|nr:16S rRNA (adenine(1518)-N(6)/adenine(1519)-N(6))-dimethyltransferase RsmA [Oscillospiraceae bacterium]
MNNLPKEFKFSKKLGQNFLIDKTIPKRIVQESGTDGKNILEIGPGAGALTVELASSASSVLALEVDPLLIAPLKEMFATCPNVQIEHTDALKCDIAALCDDYFGSDADVVVRANLPYAITSPILIKLIESRRFSDVTVMVQLEVAERIAAKAGSPEYGAFSIFCQYYTEPKLLFKVPPTAFYPRPKVTSAVIKMTSKIPEFSENEKELFRLVKLAFAQRRKTLVNALSSRYDKERVLNALQKLNFTPDIRGERLSVADFASLAAELNKSA